MGDSEGEPIGMIDVGATVEAVRPSDHDIVVDLAALPVATPDR